MTLLELTLDCPAEIIAINCDESKDDTLKYLFSIGFAIGARVLVTNRGLISKNPCAVLIDDNENMVMLRASEAALIIVRELCR